MAQAPDPISELHRELSGQTVHIPNMRPLFSTWPAGTNRNLERLRRFVNEHIDRFDAFLLVMIYRSILIFTVFLYRQVKFIVSKNAILVCSQLCKSFCAAEHQSDMQN